MPRKRTASPSTSSRRARARKGKKIGINLPSLRNFWQSSGYGYEHIIFRISVGRAGFKSGVPLIPPLSRRLDLFSRSTTFLGKLCTQRTTFFTTVSSVPTSKKKPNPPYEYKVIQSDVPQAPSEASQIALTAVKSSLTTGIDDTTCEYPEGDNSSISTY